MPPRVVVRGLDGGGVLVERRVPLARLSTLEPEPIVETLADRPAIERTRGAELVVRCVVPLAEGSGAVLITLEDLRQACRFPRPLAVVARKASRQFRDAPGVDGVVVAPGKQRRSRRRAERGGVKAIVAQPLVS